MSTFLQHVGRFLRTVVLCFSLGAVGAGLLLVSPVGRLFDQRLTSHFFALNQRRAEHRLRSFERVECYLLYNGIALGGRLLYPEGADVVSHYLHGEGKDLWLSADYIKTSRVVRQRLALLNEGESRQFAFSQSADPRLSYVVNPFNLKKKDGKVLLWQRIEFKTDPTTYTTLDYGAGRFRLPDALIHALHPRAYTLYAQWDDDSDQ